MHWGMGAVQMRRCSKHIRLKPSGGERACLVLGWKTPACGMACAWLTSALTTEAAGVQRTAQYWRARGWSAYSASAVH